ncbi:MAG: acyltransferase domain-containing protein, partial [Candidatus Binatia bacterium]
MTQPALFVVEYALARLIMDWGLKPQAMIGHSIGEFVAACLADVFSLEDALALVGKRAQLMNQLPAGSMLAVPLAAEEVSRLLGSEISLAADNGLSLSVVSGPTEAIDQLEKELGRRGMEGRRLHTSHAFHSKMMDPILEQFADQIKKVKRAAPKIPYLSNVSGTWITAAEATDPYYWTKHLRHTVRFAEGVHELLKEPARVLLEIGPGQTLSSLATQQADRTAEQVVLSSMRHPRNAQTDEAFLIHVLGKLWLAGTRVVWSSFYAKERRLRLPLPTYPFERQRYWVEPKKAASHDGTRRASLGKKPDIADWFYIPSWKRSRSPTLKHSALADQKICWLVFMDERGVGHELVKRLEHERQNVVSVRVGGKFGQAGEALYTVNPRARDDYDLLIKDLRAKDMIPSRIVHLWSVTHSDPLSSGVESFDKTLYLGFYSLLFLARALAEQYVTTAVQLDVISNQMHEVGGEALICPEKATVLGPCKVISQEYTNMTCRSIDIDPANEKEEGFVDRLMAELFSKPTDLVVAHRRRHRWLQTFEPIRLEETDDGVSRLRQNGIYLITGGLGNIGLVLAEYLAKTVKAKLILIGRSSLPAKEEREQYLQSHDDRDGLSVKIRKVQALEEAGAEVLTLSADVADQEQMAAVMAQATQRFGAIHGVI